jgi:hypothetical protein
MHPRHMHAKKHARTHADKMHTHHLPTGPQAQQALMRVEWPQELVGGGGGSLAQPRSTSRSRLLSLLAVGKRALSGKEVGGVVPCSEPRKQGTGPGGCLVWVVWGEGGPHT